MNSHRSKNIIRICSKESFGLSGKVNLKKYAIYVISAKIVWSSALKFCNTSIKITFHTPKKNYSPI